MSALGNTSEAFIARMALVHVGAETNIESLNEDTPEAAAIRTWYDFCRLEALENFDWSFARKRRLGSLDGQDPPQEDGSNIWGYRYQYPEDAIVLRKIQHPWSPPDEFFPFEVETNDAEQKTILTDIQDATFVYTFDVVNPGRFTPLFTVALSHLLASRIAFTLTGKRHIGVDNFNLYTRYKKEAEASNANESKLAPPPDADWIRAREGTTLPIGERTTLTTFPDGNN